MWLYAAVAVIAVVRFSASVVSAKSVQSFSQPLFTNQFAVRIPSGDPDTIAEKHGFINVGQIGSLDGYYVFEHPKLRKRSVNKHVGHHENLRQEPGVEWVKQQEVKKRTKRDWPPSELSTASPQQQSQQQQLLTRPMFPDPLYPQQWYLNGGADGGMDMNVAPAWAKGYTGKGVVVTILDDGIQTNHPDLIDNYDPRASSDMNDNDKDPTPRDNGDNKHGTRCAGEVAASAYNSHCGVGVAYNASIGGVRMLDGAVSDAVEAAALSLNPSHVDIYSASWGPEDDGQTVDGPGPLATRAFINGIVKGRGGKGSIFVWASGNGGMHTDSCNCDGYTNSVYTLSISSATQAGLKPWYLEECSSTIATTYSSGILGRDRTVVTVDMDPMLRPEKLCTTDHTGTSASAPLAAGMCALALEANPNLTWRDLQHIVVMSANPRPLQRESGWVLNGARRKVSHKFGYGLMDGAAMVTLAEQWSMVPPQHICKTPIIAIDRPINKSFGSELALSTNVSGCDGQDNEVHYLEHVQCKVSLSFFPRGNLKLLLVSPSGTPSTLLAYRPKDEIAATLDDWPFLSVHFWGEDPRGQWTLRILNNGRKKVDTDGVFIKWQLYFYGTDTKPVNLRPPSLQLYKNNQDKITETDFYKPKTESGNLGYDDNTIDEGSEVLYDCHSECDSKGCYGPEDTQCISCANYKLNKSCVALCSEEGYYPADGECKKCHPDCLTCTGPGYHSCLTCAPHFFYITDLAICMHTCPHTYFPDVAAKQCISCHETCLSCDEAPNICSSCDPHLVLHNGSCYATCPPGTYTNRHQRCSSCHPSCEECSGPRSTDCIHRRRGLMPSCGDSDTCTHCPSGLLLMNTTCVSSCGPGWYQSGNVCRRCWQGCASCYGGRKDECISCQPGKILARGQCRLHCPRNMYSTANGCANCHHFCSTCNGGGAYSCTTCAPTRYLDETSGLCYACHNSCYGCTSASDTSCTSCRQDLFLDNGQCVKSPSKVQNLINQFDISSSNKFHGSSAGKRRISETDSELWEQPLFDSGEGLDESEGSYPVQEGFHRSKPPPEYSPFVTVTVIAVVACLAIIVLFALLFATLQVR